MSKSDVLVLGSINMDISLKVNQLPRIGETILSEGVDYQLGGKGSNQAVAAYKISQGTDFIACVGEDSFGQTAIRQLGQVGSPTDTIMMLKGAHTGMATVLKIQGDNSIVVANGANKVANEQTRQAIDKKLPGKRVLLTQLETNFSDLEYALRKAKGLKVINILNPAPYHPIVNDLLPYVDIVTPNETEFENIIGRKLTTREEFKAAMVDWVQQNDTQLILTKGSEGSLTVIEGQVHMFPAINVDVVDTTGAGDTFNGILASLVARGESLEKAIRFATVGASLSTEGYGPQAAMPGLDQIIERLESPQEKS